MFRGPEVSRWHAWQYDPYKIVVYEAFLAFCGALLAEERFDLLGQALSKPYLVRREETSGGRTTSDFSIFNTYAESLTRRTQRLKLNRIDLQADLMEEAHRNANPSFEDMMQADFILLLRSSLADQEPTRGWYPRSLVFAGRRFRPFDVFARCESRAYFNTFSSHVLGGATLEQFKATIGAVASTTRNWFDYNGLAVAHLANRDNLGLRE
ncbi:MAG TPA: hypothetical protein VF631_14945 [Allosphingosinicella sp.]|jgi:hypothetical protein|uniref:hypothetical protein n=1 Tax=Allosphingosinicella sp. TaxID=2823234 RepID=UPI002F286B5A